MNDIKVAQSGLTLAAPLRVLLGKENGEECGLPFANCALYAVMPDRNQPFTDFELHYYGGMKNSYDKDEIQFVDGVIEFSAERLVEAYNEPNMKKVTDIMSTFIEDIAVAVQKNILYAMKQADFLNDQEYEAYTEWTKVYAKPLCRLEEPEELVDEHNYISGSLLVAQIAFDLAERVLTKVFLGV